MDIQGINFSLLPVVTPKAVTNPSVVKQNKLELVCFPLCYFNMQANTQNAQGKSTTGAKIRLIHHDSKISIKIPSQQGLSLSCYYPLESYMSAVTCASCWVFLHFVVV